MGDSAISGMCHQTKYKMFNLFLHKIATIKLFHNLWNYDIGKTFGIQWIILFMVVNNYYFRYNKLNDSKIKNRLLILLPFDVTMLGFYFSMRHQSVPFLWYGVIL